jgi:hypothetical protein
MNIWKWGTNWYSTLEGSHYDYINYERIVFGVSGELQRGSRIRFHKPYSIGDLVLITKGTLVLAITQVLEDPVPITSDPDLEAIALELNVLYAPTTVRAKADWYELPDDLKWNLSRGYQGGTMQIKVQEIKEKVIRLWNERT